MTSLLRTFLANFDHPATVENLGVAPEPAPEVDVDAFDERIEGLLELSRENAERDFVAS